MRPLLALLVWILRATLVARSTLVLENLALRQQLATYARLQTRPRLKPEERAFWAALSRVWKDWRSPLLWVKPATVIDWHRRGFRRYWRWRARKPGRPRIPAEHIGFIQRISSDQPGWGEDRIAEVPAAFCRRASSMRAAVLSARARPATQTGDPERSPSQPGRALSSRVLTAGVH
jgi:hypothetical protein